jgi:hypothetical protein
VSQLSIGHQRQFPVVLTHQYACDVKVIRMLRQRGLGNGTTMMYKKLCEQHGEIWLKKTSHYLTDAKAFKDATKSGLINLPSFQEPPSHPPVPSPKWLFHIYGRDVMARLQEVKASITSIFGNVLKMDSTKKVTKKLSGYGSGTATWVTNVDNQYGQVLIIVKSQSKTITSSAVCHDSKTKKIDSTKFL